MLFILRHGQAEPYRSDDASRALVPRGVVQVQRSATWLGENNYRIETCYASPFLRAQQTAHVLLQHNHWQIAIQSEQLLTPDTDPVLVASWIDTLDEENILLAAHMPIVSRLTEQLCQQRIEFATASIAVLQRHDGRWKLSDFYTPEQ